MVKFTVRHKELGNQVNPMGYARTTQAGKWNNTYKRYQAFKTSVVAAYCDKTGQKFRISTKPIRDRKKYYVAIVCYFKSLVHADPDNVAKAINDSLFHNDKHVAGSYDYEYVTDDPRVEVSIRDVNATQ